MRGPLTGGASLEWLPPGSALIRVHDPGGTYGDPYVRVVVVCPAEDDPLIAVLKGMVGDPGSAAARTIRAAIYAAGFEGWEMHRADGRTVRYRRSRPRA